MLEAQRDCWQRYCNSINSITQLTTVWKALNIFLAITTAFALKNFLAITTTFAYQPLKITCALLKLITKKQICWQISFIRSAQQQTTR